MRTAASRRFSSFGRHPLRSGLWAVAAALAVVVVGLLVWSFTRPEDMRRENVAAYIASVNRIEGRLAAQLTAVDESYRSFGRNPAALERQVADLERAERTIRDLRTRLSRLTPPEEARRLHTLLLRLLDMDVEFAGEVTALARYLPDLTREQAPLDRALQALRRGVDAAETGPQQAEAFAVYAAATRKAASRIEALDPPVFFQRTEQAEVARLRRLANVSARVSAALEAGDADEAVRLFSTLGEVASTPGVARAQRAAAIAYNDRLKTIRTTAETIAKERARLDRTVL